MPENTYLITAAEIAAMEGTPKTHFLNPNAQRRNISLGDATGLTGMGFHIIDVAPGFETTEYHMHHFEDECVYVVSGHATARIGDEDAGYILGGVIAGRYRGFQISYTEAAEPHSIGNLLQLHELRRLAAEGVTIYDMGMDMDYKRRWADQEMTTHTVMVVRH